MFRKYKIVAECRYQKGKANPKICSRFLALWDGVEVVASSTSSSVIRLVWHQLFFDRHFVDSRISIAPNWFHFLDRMPGISQRSIACPNPSILPLGLMTASRSVGRGSDQRARLMRRRPRKKRIQTVKR